MSQIPSTSATGGSSTSTGKSQGNALQDLDIDQFLKLMISELQNQDPLNPMDNVADARTDRATAADFIQRQTLRHAGRRTDRSELDDRQRINGKEVMR